MAWGLWNKIKQGIKKVGSAVKTGAKFVNNNIIKPFKPMIGAVADKFIPGGSKIVDVVSDGIDEFSEGRGKTWASNQISNLGVRPGFASANEIRPYKKLNL